MYTLSKPEICPFCGKASRAGTCPECREKLRKLEIQERCMQCSRPVRYEQSIAAIVRKPGHFYDQGWQSAGFTGKPVNQSIYRFKYQNQRRFAAHYQQNCPGVAERRRSVAIFSSAWFCIKRKRGPGIFQASCVAEGWGVHLRFR